MRKAPGVALLTFLAFGCGTVRVQPEAAPAAPGDLGPGVAEPVVELWVEGTREVDPAEAAQDLAEARDALARAVAGRGAVAAGEGAVLQVTERAVVRTSARRRDQTMAIVGMVVGFVIVVAIVVVALVSGRGKGGSPLAASGARAAPPAPAVHAVGAAAAGRAGRVAGGAVAGAFPGRVRPAPALLPAGAHPVAPAPPRGLVPYPWAPPPVVGPPPPPLLFDVDLGYAFDLAAPPYALPPEEAPEEEAPPPVPSPPSFDLGDRGFFSGEDAQIEIAVRDAQTGEPLWATSIRKDVDARDPRKVAGLLEEALRGQDWARQRPPGPPAGAEVR